MIKKTNTGHEQINNSSNNTKNIYLKARTNNVGRQILTRAYLLLGQKKLPNFTNHMACLSCTQLKNAKLSQPDCPLDGLMRTLKGGNQSVGALGVWDLMNVTMSSSSISHGMFPTQACFVLGKRSMVFTEPTDDHANKHNV